jgi:hypothetical protein
MLIHPINSGRLMIRDTPEGGSAVVGVIHLPKDVAVEENTMYLLLLRNGRATLATYPLGVGLPNELEGQGVGAALCAPIWLTTTDATAVCVRLLGAFPQANGWTVYGASSHALRPDPGMQSSRGDEWFDIRTGEIRSIEPPAPSAGAQPQQLLTNAPVWPDRHGEPHVLCQHSIEWRHHYFRLSQLQAEFGAGERSLDDLMKAIRNDPHLSRIHCGSPSREYAEFLATLRDAGGLVEARPCSASDHAERDALVARCLPKREMS